MQLNIVKYLEPLRCLSNKLKNSIYIRVRDTGIGIEPNEQHQVFDKFYRSNNEDVRERTGHGLGLSLAKDIINYITGNLKVQSELGQGSEFTIVLENNSSMLERAV